MSLTTALRQKITAIFLVLVLISLVTPAFSSELSSKKKELNNVNSQLNQTRQKIKQAKTQEAHLVSEIKSVDDRIMAAQKDFDKFDAELKQVRLQRGATERQLEALQVELWNTQQDLDRTEAKLLDQKTLLNNRVESIYKRGKSGYLDVILNSSDFTNFLNRLRFLEYIVAQDVDIVGRIEETKALIEDKKHEVEQNKSAVNSERIKLVSEEQHVKELTEAQLAKKRALEAEVNKKQALLSEIKENRAAYELAEDQLLESSASLVSKIKELERRANRGGSSARPAGFQNGDGFAWPTSGSVTSPFGMRKHPILGVMRMHTGIDIGAPHGQSVISVQSGTVIQAGWIKGYGQTVIISHGDGISSLYAHLSSISVSEGESVSKGATIGRIGSTGLSTGPHLHFEIRKNGEPQNPMNWY